MARSLSIFTHTLVTILSFTLQYSFFMTSAQAQPLQSRQTPAGSSDSPNVPDTYINDPTGGSAPNNYSEPPGPSNSLFPHLSVIFQIMIIGGAFMVSGLAVIFFIFAYLRHRTKVEIKEERRRTAFRMSMMVTAEKQQQRHISLERRRKSQMIIMQALENLRDEPESRPALPVRASTLPAGITQSGIRTDRSWKDHGSPFERMRDISLDDDDKSIYDIRAGRRMGFI